jgi:CheY-like chemotaxis protein
MTDHAGILAGRRVLIIEKEALIAAAVEEEVWCLGARNTYLALHKHKALEAIEQFKPEVVIVDVSLAGTGRDYEIADTLADRGIPFIFSFDRMAAELPDRHVGRPIVSKPMDPRAFAEAVSMALR